MAEAAGAGTRAKEAESGGGSQGAEVKSQQPAEKTLAAPRRDPHSVLKVSQLLLGAMVSDKPLTVATLRKELGNAGYEVRRRCRRRSGAARPPGVPGTLIRVSGSHASGCLRVWKPPKPKKKPCRPRLEGSARSCRTPSGLRSPRRRRRVRCRKAARRAREVWRRNARAKTTALRRLRPRARGRARSGARADSRAKGKDRGRGRAARGDGSRSRGKRPREEKKQGPEKPGKRTPRRSASAKGGPRAARPHCRRV